MSADERSDAEVLAAVAAGDRLALAVLYRRHGPWLLVRLSRRCADASVVDEVLQDTFVAVWQGATKYSGQGDVAAWVWGIGIRRLVDALRRRPPATLTMPDQIGVDPSAEERVLV